MLAKRNLKGGLFKCLWPRSNYVRVAPASPPDVRRGSASPFNLEFDLGLRPWFGLCPDILWAKGQTKGVAHAFIENFDGAAEPRLTSGGEAGANGQKSPFRLSGI